MPATVLFHHLPEPKSEAYRADGAASAVAVLAQFDTVADRATVESVLAFAEQMREAADRACAGMQKRGASPELVAAWRQAFEVGVSRRLGDWLAGRLLQHMLEGYAQKPAVSAVALRAAGVTMH